MLKKIISTAIMFSIIFAFVSCGGGGGSEPATTAGKEITSFSFETLNNPALENNIQGMITGNNISCNMPYGTDVSSLVATFTTSGTEVTVNDIIQESGITSNDFSAALIYIVSAVNGTTSEYTVTIVFSPPPANELTAFSINGCHGQFANNTITVLLPVGSAKTSLAAKFVTTGTWVSVNGMGQISDSTLNNFSGPVVYTVHAAGGETRDYTVYVYVPDTDSRQILYFALMGSPGVISGNNITVTLPNGTDVSALTAAFLTSGSEVTVNGTVQVSGTTVNDYTNPVTYTVKSTGGATSSYTVKILIASADAKELTAFYAGGVYGVFTDATHILLSLPYGTDVTALAAFFTTSGQRVTVNGVTQVCGINPNDFSSTVVYMVHAADGTAKNFYVDAEVSDGSSKDLFSYSIEGSEGVINETDRTITVILPNGVNIANAVASFTTSGENVTVNGTGQVSGVTPNNFTNPVVYTVKALNGSTKTYTVTAYKNSDKDIIWYYLADQTGTINGTTITVNVPNGTDRSSLVAYFGTTGVSVKIGSTEQVSGSTVNNFTTSKTYTVYADDGSTKNYTVNVNVTSGASSSKYITYFALAGNPGEISGSSIYVSVPYGTAITNIVPEITYEGVSITPAAGTARNFSSPVYYTVTAQDGSSMTYTVITSVMSGATKEITSFSVDGYPGRIDDVNNEIGVVIPVNVDRSSMTAAFSTTGKKVRIGSVVQTSGVTSNDFRNPVVYTVEAADGSKRMYTVRVSGVMPSAPGAATITPGTRQLSLSWSPVTNATAYTVWYSTMNNSSSAIQIGGDISNTGYTITGLADGTTYFVWLKAKNATGSSVFGAVSNGMTPPPAPGAPVVTAGTRQLALTWSPVSGATAYTVWYSTVNNSSTAIQSGGDISNTGYTITGLADGTTYFVWLKAKNSGGTSGYGTVSSGITAPSSPGAPVVTAGTRQLILSWSPVSGATAYSVWYSTVNNSSSAIQRGGDISNTGYTITGLADNTTYFVWLKAKNSGATSGYGAVSSGTTPLSAPGAPVVTAGTRQLALSWSPVSGATAYTVWYGTVYDTGSAIQSGGDISATGYTITGLTEGMTYFVWLKAKNSSGTSGFSPVSGGTIPDTTEPVPGSSGTITAGSVTATTLVLSWTAGSDNLTIQSSLQYAVYRSTSNNISTVSGCESYGVPVQAYTANLTALTVSGLSAGTSYYFNLVVKDSAGNKVCYTAKEQTTKLSDVYCGGSSINSSNITVPIYWKNGTRVELTPIDSTKDAYVSSIYITGSDVYCGGYSTNSSDIRLPVYWKNGTRVELTPIDSTKDAYVNSIYISGSDVYCGGYSINSANITVPVYWKNGTRVELAPINSTKNAYVRSIYVSGSDVYCGGSSISSNILVPVYWKNSTRNTLTPIDSTKSTEVSSIYFSGSDLYCGGSSMNSSNIAVPVYWKNGTRTALTPFDYTKTTWVYSIYVFGNDLYCGGYGYNSSYVIKPVYWKNGTRKDLTPIVSTGNAQVNSIFVVSQ